MSGFSDSAEGSPSWLVDKSRIATKIKRASTDSELVFFETNPSRACSNCHYVIDNSDVWILINEFCVKQDGSISHFFHLITYNILGTRKRRKIQDGDFGDVRWHKTGRTKPVTLDGVRRGCKKIMVLYVSPAKGGKAEKTNWVMHQYHLGTQEDEKEGEYVVSKIFYQQQQLAEA
ncbi:hypothetical protein Leryth_026470 [Lithospermum erythrorhizon]|nr:hypothetical protein Leryth_026470 [Lithospermum erythrorhizon]